jgi:hypothetical protein
MRPLSFHWHRFFEWVHGLYAEHLLSRFERHYDRAREHGVSADKICPPEWPVRLWDRDHDAGTEQKERRP